MESSCFWREQDYHALARMLCEREAQCSANTAPAGILALLRPGQELGIPAVGELSNEDGDAQEEEGCQLLPGRWAQSKPLCCPALQAWAPSQMACAQSQPWGPALRPSGCPSPPIPCL